MPQSPQCQTEAPELQEPASKRVRMTNAPMLPESQSSSSTVNPQTSNNHEHNPPNNLPRNPPEENEHNLPQQKIPNSGEDSERPSTHETTPDASSVDRHAIDLVPHKHGPKFLKLKADEQSGLIRIHRNLGHPGTHKLVKFCWQLRYPESFLHAIPDMHCSTCQETQQAKVARPAAIHEPMDFGEVV